MTFADLHATWIARAAELEPYAPGAAEAFRRAARELDDAVREFDEAPLTLEQASEVSGYSVDHLARMVREKRIPNIGEKHRPRVRRADVPMKPSALRSIA